MILLLFALFFFLLFIGVPIAFAMAASALFTLILGTNVPLILIVQRVFAGADSFPLLAIPFFIIAGEVMTATHMTKALVDLCQSLVGRMRAGLGGVAVAACVVFSGISGSGSADTAAIGSVMIPQLVARGYPRGVAAAIIAVAGALGPIIPPSLLMIIYGAIAEQSIGMLFLSGIIPGLLVGVGLFFVVMIGNTRLHWEEPSTVPFDLCVVWRSFRASLIPLGVPLVIIVGILGGIFTTTESSVIAAVYALVAAYLYRRFTWAELRAIFLRSGLLSSLSLFVIAMSAIFSWILAREGFPDQMVQLTQTLSGGHPLLAGAIVISILLILGIFVEVLPLIIIFTPTLAPLGIALGYDPIHWGLLMVMSMNIGGITPPVGANLFIAASIAGCKLREMGFWSWILTGVHVVVVFLVLIWPDLATWIPRAVMK
jgi:C4-dicarboxylate transporter, DctM subunit